MSHPYKSQKPRAFWSSSVGNVHPLNVADLYVPKFELTNLNIATAGSCFAQHLGRYIKDSELKFLDLEQPPVLMPRALYKNYGYDLYSARYGNVYTTRQLLQLFRRAFGTFEPLENIWPAANGATGFVDPFRPSIEPKPSISEEEVLRLQRFHLKNVRFQ